MGYRGKDRGAQIGGRGERTPLAAANDAPGNRAPAPLLAQIAEQKLQILLGEGVGQVGRRRAGGRVHSHVERLIILKAEPATGPLEQK